MIFTTMLVHILEVAVAVLLLATAVQLVRCNRAFNKAKQTPPLITPLTLKPLNNPVEQTYGKSANILHDYIGEFFVDETIADELQAYKNTEVTKTTLTSQVKLSTIASVDAAIKADAVEKHERSNILSFEERIETASDKALTEDEDDSVITVVNNSHAPDGVTDENVMSDKVVHAMLDEAKLVCAS